MAVVESSAGHERAYELVPEGFSLEGWRDVSLEGDDKLMISAVIPTSQIVREDVPLDHENLRDVRGLIEDSDAKGEGMRGQLVPGILGIVPEYGDEGWLRIVDCFHRFEIQDLRGGVGLLLVKVFPELDIPELTRRRIGHTKNHGPIELARSLGWSRELWERRGFPEELTVVEAFRAAVGRPSKKLSDETNAKGADWVAEFTEDWKIGPEVMLEHLSSAEGLPTSLTDLIVEGGRGLTLKKARMIAEFFPGDDEFQLLAAETVRDHGLSEPKTRSLLGQLETDGSMDAAEATIDNFVRYMGAGRQTGGRSRSTTRPSTSLPRRRTVNELLQELDDRLTEVPGNVLMRTEGDVIHSLLAKLRALADGSESDEATELSFGDLTLLYLRRGGSNEFAELVLGPDDAQQARNALREFVKGRELSADERRRHASVNQAITAFNERR